MSLNHKFYKKAFDKYGVSSKGVHWNSQRNQYIRFEILISNIRKEIKSSSILDIGCGYGELLNFFQIKELEPFEYLGIDCEEFMIEESKKRFPLNSFLKCDILLDEIPKKDYLLCSGALNILKKEDFFNAIKHCFYASKKGFIFNFLTKETFNKIDKEDVITFCENLTSKIIVSKTYLPNDMTIYLLK